MNKRTIYLVVILSFILCVNRGAHAQPELDISFNGTGHVTSGFDSGIAYIADVVVQPDKKVVGIGTWHAPNNASSHFALTRYNEDGTIDTSFGQFGRVVSDFDPDAPGESATAGTIQPDGKIIAAGYVNGPQAGQSRITVARYNTDGSLDLTFGSGGKFFYQQTPSINEAYTVAVGPDGSIAAAGEYFAGATIQTVVIRLDPSGVLQASMTDIRGSILNDRNVPTSVAIQPDGKIITSGFFSPSGGAGGITFVRYNPDGSKDVTFGSGGRLLLSNGSNQAINAIAVQPDGRIVGAGLSGPDFMVMRMWGNGMLDISFSDDGRASAAFPTSGAATAVHVKPNGKIIAAGTVAANFAVAVFNADGSLDTSFSGDGTLRFGFPGFSSSGADSIVIDSLGRIVLGGSAGSKFAAARLYTLEPAPVAVSGRAVTPDGMPIRGISVGLTSQAGETRWAITSTFGYYQFDGVPTGQTYTLFVRGAKRHTFENRTFGLNEAVDDLNLIGVPRETAARAK
jgi:uncharacterized delta-60 repeat protein